MCMDLTRNALRLLSVCACRLASGSDLPPETPTPVEKTRAAALVKQLGAEEYFEREAAMAALRKMGLKAREALETAKQSQDSEVVLRVAKLLPLLLHIEDENAWLAAMKGAWPEALQEGKLSGPLFGASRVAKASNELRPFVVEGAPRKDYFNWLAINQEEDGHWNARLHGAQVGADVEVTALALLSFLCACHTEKIGKYRDTVKRAVEWLKAQQRVDGAILNPGWTEVDGVTHALAGMALAEAAGMGHIPETMQAAQKAVEYSSEVHQVGAGDVKSGFGRAAKSKTPDLLTSTFFAMQLKSAKVAALKVNPAAFQGLMKFLDQVDDTNAHAFSLISKGKSSPQATFMGCTARMLMGWKSEDLAPYLEQAVQVYPGPSIGEECSDVLCNYFGTLAAYQQGGDLWKTWNGKRNKSLCEAQQRGGAADGSWNPTGPWAGAGRVFATAMNGLCLEVHSRCYMPLYKE